MTYEEFETKLREGIFKGQGWSFPDKEMMQGFVDNRKKTIELTDLECDIAKSAAQRMVVQNKAGKKVSVMTAKNKSYAEKDPAAHKKAKSIFQRIKDKFLKKEIDEYVDTILEDLCLCEACQKGYMTHPTRKTKIMFGKRYRNCVKKEGVDTTMSLEEAGMIADNICVNCGDFANENLRKWFKDRWVNIGKKKKGGGHPPCGTSGKKRGYAKCVPASKAARMTKKQKASATRRKRAAQNKANRGGKQSAGQGKKPIYVSTKPKK